MKKAISLLLILALLLSVTSAFAANSKRGKDIPGTDTDAEGYQIIVVEEKDKATEKTIEQFAAANAEGNPVSAFPQSVVDQLANGKPAVNEIIPIEAIGDLTEVTDTETTFTLDTPYSPKDVVQLVIGIPVKDVDTTSEGEEFMEWHVLDATVNEDGSLTTTVPEDLVLKLENGGTMVVVNNGPVIIDIPDTEELATIKELLPDEKNLISVQGFNYDETNTDSIQGVLHFPGIDAQTVAGKKLTVAYGYYLHGKEDLVNEDIIWDVVPAEIRENGEIVTSVNYITANEQLKVGCAYLIIE